MKKIVSKLSVSVIIVLLGVFMFISWKSKQKNILPQEVYQNSSVIRTNDGYAYRDLNKNGKMDVYEDAKQSVEARIDDLLNK